MRFGEFEIDLQAGELFRDDTQIRIQDLPFRVLVTLLEHPNEVVTREQLGDRLWGTDTFVDREAGLNTAVAKLREALGDNAETPRFIETLPRRGYRLRMPVESAPASAERSAAAEVVASTAIAGPPAETARSRDSGARAWARWSVAAGVVLLAGATVATAWLRSDRNTTVAVMLFHNETGDSQYDRLAQQLTDGTVVALAGNPALDVIGNAAVLRTPRIFADIQKVGDALGAQYVLLGQVQRGADGLVVRTHFVRVSDQKHLWAHPTTGDANRLDREVPLEVATGVRDALAR